MFIVKSKLNFCTKRNEFSSYLLRIQVWWFVSQSSRVVFSPAFFEEIYRLREERPTSHTVYIGLGLTWRSINYTCRS